MYEHQWKQVELNRNKAHKRINAEAYNVNPYLVKTYGLKIVEVRAKKTGALRYFPLRLREISRRKYEYVRLVKPLPGLTYTESIVKLNS